MCCSHLKAPSVIGPTPRRFQVRKAHKDNTQKVRLSSGKKPRGWTKNTRRFQVRTAHKDNTQKLRLSSEKKA